MSRKSRERRKARSEPEKSPTAVEAVRKRRNRRFLVVALLGLSFPILELIAYQFRAITVTVHNRTKQPVTNLKVTYSGGSFESPEIKPGGSITRLIRPDFSFTGAKFATYRLEIGFSAAGGIVRQSGRAGTIDFSAHETYTIEPAPIELPLQLRHSTSPGFPLSLVRDLFGRMGFG